LRLPSWLQACSPSSSYPFPSIRPSRRHRSPSRLSTRRVGLDGREQRHPDHRAEDDRVRQDALPVGTSDSAGASRIELTFAPGTDPDLAWAQVQNKLQLAMASLPDVVQRQGIKVSKSTRNYLMIVGLISEDGSMDGNDLRDLRGVESRKGPGAGARRRRGNELRLASMPCASG
jgi:hypothetical protein